MAKSVTFTVEPSADHHDVLTIQDAFQQAIDFFDLLTDERATNVVWKLEMASTNSPFTCRGEPVDTRTWSGAYAAVSTRVEVVERNFERISRGLDFDETFPRDKIDKARKIIQRNTNGIGRSTVKFGEDSKPIEINQEDAKRYLLDVLDPQQSLHSYLFGRTSRREYGSVEGRIIEITTDYDQPAVILEEHKSGRKISCRMSADATQKLSEDLKAGDAWEHRRVRVRGALNYDAKGNVIRVMDGTVSYITAVALDFEDASTENFTEGYSVAEYLDRLRENEFGD